MNIKKTPRTGFIAAREVRGTIPQLSLVVPTQMRVASSGYAEIALKLCQGIVQCIDYEVNLIRCDREWWAQRNDVPRTEADQFSLPK